MIFNKKEIILIIFVYLIAVSKISYYHQHLYTLETWKNREINHYLEVSKWFTDHENNEISSDQSYLINQLGPLYSILLIPSFYMNLYEYLLILNYVFLLLLAFLLYSISKKFINYYSSIFITGLVLLFFPLNNLMINKPIIICMFLFACFIYFIIDIKYKRGYWGSSIFFMLLILTKSLFFYLLPFIFLVMFYNFRKKMKLRAYIYWFIPSAVFFLLWGLRDMFIYGFSLKGFFGGYYVLLVPSKSGFLNLNYNPERYVSFIESSLFPLIMFFLISIFFIFLYLHRFPSIFNKYFKNYKQFNIFLSINLFIFILFPGSTWNLNYVINQYIEYLLPVYLLFPFIFIAIQIKELKKIWNYYGWKKVLPYCKLKEYFRKFKYNATLALRLNMDKFE